MSRRNLMRRVVLLSSLIAVLLAFPAAALAYAPANDHIDRVWERTDAPVESGATSRTWVWGPEGFTPDCTEPYLDSPAGSRLVQYFDKSRMEINDPDADPDSTWFVTQGLLARELMTGEMQVGDAALIDWGAADVHIAGDPGGGAPSYADFAMLMDVPPLDGGESVVQTVDADGQVGQNPAMAGYGVIADTYVPATDHRVASVFWDFMNSEGLVQSDGALINGPIFENAFYGVGLPLTEAYWMNIQVGGVDRDVLVQAFERRVLTYTPENPDGWEVEAGNVGQHYFIWRYGSIPAADEEACPDTLEVTFHVYEPRDNQEWEQVAVTRTSEVFHPGGVATGIWRAYSGSTIAAEALNSTGTMVAEHTYGYVFPGRFLIELEARVQEITGPSGGSAQIWAGDFSVGTDSRVAGSVGSGAGWVSYVTQDESGTVGFTAVGTLSGEFHVFLDGPAPPVFFPQ